MSAIDFATPIFVRSGRHLVQEVASIGDATDFLLDWTETRHDILAETLLRACYDVRDGSKPVETIEKGFRQFAQRVGIIEYPITVMPWVAVKNGGGGRVPA